MNAFGFIWRRQDVFKTINYTHGGLRSCCKRVCIDNLGLSLVRCHILFIENKSKDLINKSGYYRAA